MISQPYSQIKIERMIQLLLRLDRSLTAEADTIVDNDVFLVEQEVENLKAQIHYERANR